MSTNITDKHRDEFEALRKLSHDDFALISCFCNGEPTAAIAWLVPDEEGYQVHPLFVAVTPSMVLTDHDGVEPKG